MILGSYCIDEHEIPDLQKLFPRSYWIQGIKGKKDHYYYFNRSSLYPEDWFLQEINEDFLNENEVEKPSEILKEIYDYSDEELEPLKLAEEIN